MRTICYPAVMVFFCALPLTGITQETTAEIAGTVNAYDSAFGGASIIALHIPTGTKYTTTSRKDGRYNLPNLKVGGPYQVKVTCIGYSTDSTLLPLLELGQSYMVDFSLQQYDMNLPGVAVSANNQNAIINKNRTGSQTIISSDMMQQLPTINRSAGDFLRLTPFANKNNLAGGSAFSNRFTIDGASLANESELPAILGTNITGNAASLETFEQIQVSLAPYDVRQGGFAGGNINIITRSGSNQFKGSVYGFHNGPDLRGYKTGNKTYPATDYQSGTTGFFVSGPIIRNKLFFFISAEQQLQTRTYNKYVAADTTNEPGGNVSFVQADALDSLRQFLVDRFGYDPGVYDDYDYEKVRRNLSVKIDWNIATGHVFTLKMNYSAASEENPVSNSGAPRGSRQPGLFSLPFYGSGYTNNNYFLMLLGELNSHFNNQVSNKLQFGYRNNNEYRKSIAGKVFPFVDIMDGFGNAYTSFGYDPLSYKNSLYIQTYQLSDFVTVYKSNHELLGGVQGLFTNYTRGFAPNFAGTYRYKSLADFYTSIQYNLPGASRYTLQYNADGSDDEPVSGITSTELAFLLQDKWSISSSFTLTTGLRFDLPVYTNQTALYQKVDQLKFRNDRSYSDGTMPAPKLLVSPRIGFNWDVASERVLQVRGGAGVFTGSMPLVWLTNTGNNANRKFAQVATNRVLFSPDIDFHRPAEGEPSHTYSVVFVEDNLTNPSVLKTSLGIDVKLPWDMYGTFEMMYSKDLNSIYFQNVNIPAAYRVLAGPDARVHFDRSRIYDGFPQPAATNPDIDKAMLISTSTKGYSWGFTAQVQKTLDAFSFSAAYTYSRVKSITDWGSLHAITWEQRPVSGDPNIDETGFPSSYLPHRVIAYAGYRVAYAKHLATSFGLIFEASPSGVGSYTYIGDLNNDGIDNNDLMYIPRDQSDIVLVPVGNEYNGITDSRSPQQIWEQLNAYITQDDYLNRHRGEVAERNAVTFPFQYRLDLNVTQDFYFVTKKTGTSHTLSVSIDIFNFTNLVNRNWGVGKVFLPATSYVPNVASILQFEGIAPPGDVNEGKPMFSFLYQDIINEIPYQQTYTDDPSPLSRWQAQIGIRYSFK